MGRRQTRIVVFFRSFPGQISAVLILVAVCASYPLAHASAGTNIAVFIGALISTVNILLGYAAIEYSAGRSYVTLMKYTLGGMGLRMAAMLGAFFLCIRVFEVPVVPLSVSMMGFYIVYLVLEIIYINTRVHTIHSTVDHANSTN